MLPPPHGRWDYDWLIATERFPYYSNSDLFVHQLMELPEHPPSRCPFSRESNFSACTAEIRNCTLYTAFLSLFLPSPHVSQCPETLPANKCRNNYLHSSTLPVSLSLWSHPLHPSPPTLPHGVYTPAYTQGHTLWQQVQIFVNLSADKHTLCLESYWEWRLQR